jgi:hypothetical protein
MLRGSVLVGSGLCLLAVVGGCSAGGGKSTASVSKCLTSAGMTVSDTPITAVTGLRPEVIASTSLMVQVLPFESDSAARSVDVGMRRDAARGQANVFTRLGHSRLLVFNRPLLEEESVKVDACLA